MGEKDKYSESGCSIEGGERVREDCRGSLVHCAGMGQPISAISEGFMIILLSPRQKYSGIASIIDSQ